MNLEFKYGIDFEINRIKNTLNKIEWYNKNGYKPLLPKLLDSSLESIEKSVKEEFKEEHYKEKAKEIESAYNSIKDGFEDNLKKKFDISNVSTINVILTKYGVGGSYKLPNTIIINVQGNQINKPIIEVLKHEIIHLFAEREVIKDKLSHKDKELLIKKFEKELIY